MWFFSTVTTSSVWEMEHQLFDSDGRPHSQSISIDDGFCVFRVFDLKSDPKSSVIASGGILATSCWNTCIWRRRCSRSSFNVLSREWLTLCNSDNLVRGLREREKRKERNVNRLKTYAFFAFILLEKTTYFKSKLSEVSLKLPSCEDCAPSLGDDWDFTGLLLPASTESPTASIQTNGKMLA